MFLDQAAQLVTRQLDDNLYTNETHLLILFEVQLLLLWNNFYGLSFLTKVRILIFGKILDPNLLSKSEIHMHSCK